MLTLQHSGVFWVILALAGMAECFVSANVSVSKCQDSRLKLRMPCQASMPHPNYRFPEVAMYTTQALCVLFFVLQQNCLCCIEVTDNVAHMCFCLLDIAVAGKSSSLCGSTISGFSSFCRRVFHPLQSPCMCMSCSAGTHLQINSNIQADMNKQCLARDAVLVT